MNIDPGLGIVAIGRNEGRRLIACLESLRGAGSALVYVDSGSSDQSAARAREHGAVVIELDPARPFSAARARNEGFRALMNAQPDTELVQFIDGDCVLLPGWLDSASRCMEADPGRAVVIGRLVERRPDASIYNRLCAMEWSSPQGDLSNFGMLGGIMLVRASVFLQLGGFKEEMIAGEDSEFGVRVAEAGFKVTKIDANMATHDAEIMRFGQWWRRAVRGGHAIGHRFSLHGRGAVHDCARERRSVFIWGIGLPAVIMLLAPLTAGLSLLLAGGYLVLGHRIVRYRMRQGADRADARLYARFIVIGKFAEALGLVKFYANNLLGRFRIIEYK